MGDPRWYQAWLDKAAQDKAQGIDISAILNRRIDAQINAKEKANGSAPESGLPELFINESDPTETAKELAILIARRGDLLSNGVVPVRIVADSNNYPLALELGVDGVRVVAHEVCQPVKYPLKPGRRKNGAEPKEVRKEIGLTKDIANLYLHGLERRWGLNTLCGITTAPVLKDDGSIRIASGYDRESGLWCHDIPDLILPDRPTESDARDALQGLRHFFRTFPYADSDRTTEEFEIDGEKVSVEVVNLDQPPGLDESKFLVRIMTAVCRQSLELAPGLLVRAPEISGAGTGKGLGVKAACIIGSGAKPEAFTGGQDSEELDKRLTSALIQARPTIFLDNHNAKQLQSDIIASALTENPIMVRPMGHSKMVPLHTRAFVAVTGNAVEISEDLARRFIVSNFDARVEDPESRKFKEGFIESVFADRATLLAEALTIWR